MRKSFTAMFLALAPVAALTTLAPTAPVHAQQAEVSVSLFYERLSAHGKWVEHPRWGWVWYPVAVEADWRPYTKGRWVFTDQYGWMWVSHEPFGWATYHYGRWGYDDRYGWVWVPGQQWGPAWVAFRYSEQHVGWAPLPPDTLQISASVQIDDAVLTASYYQPRWVFVPTAQFVAPQIVTHVVPSARNVTFIRQTRNVTNIRIQNDIVINRSIDPERLRAVVRRDIPRVRVQEVQDARRIDIRQRSQTNINNIQIFKKEVNIRRDARPPERARAKENDRPKVRIQEEAVRPEDRRDGRDRDRGRDRGDRPGDRDRDRATPSAPPSDRDRGGQDRGRQDRDRTTPGAPPSDRGQPDRGSPDRRGAQPDGDRTPDRRGAQPDRDRTTPDRQRRDQRGSERRDETPSRTTPDRRGATPAQPAQPPRTTPGAPPSRGQDDDKRGATPAKPATPPSRGQQDDRRGDRPGQTPSRTQDDKRGATPARPAQPPRTSPGAPPTRGQDDRRGATPAKPATPPTRGQPEQNRGATPAQPPKAAPGAPPSRQAQPQQSRPQQGQPQRGQPGKPAAPGKAPEKDEKERGPSR